MPIPRADIEDVVQKGIAQDIFIMEQAFALLRKIRERGNDIDNNKRRGHFSELFRIFHDALKTQCILAAARVYDTPHPKHPTRCLDGLLEYLVNNNDDLPSIREPYQLKLSLQSMRAPTALLGIIDNEPKKFAPAFAAHVKSLLQLRKDTLDKLRAVRNKAFAHNEQVSGICGPTWESLQDLINIAKNVVGVMGWAYFSTAYVISGEYILTGDARRPAHALDDLLNILYNQD